MHSQVLLLTNRPDAVSDVRDRLGAAVSDTAEQLENISCIVVDVASGLTAPDGSPWVALVPPDSTLGPTSVSAGALGWVPLGLNANETATLLAGYVRLAEANAGLTERVSVLARRDHERELLSQMVAHDLRSPLAALVTSLRLMEMEELPEETMEDLKLALWSTDMFTRMVQDIQDVGHGDPQIPIKYEQVTIGTIFSRVMSLQEEDGPPVKLNIEHPETNIRTDPVVLQRIITNLLDHGRRFGVMGPVHVNVDSSTDSITIEILDSGTPVAHEDRHAIFTVLGGAAIPKSRRRGRGLGLVFCKYGALALNGSVGVDTSEGLNRFRLVLPKS